MATCVLTWPLWKPLPSAGISVIELFRLVRTNGPVAFGMRSAKPGAWAARGMCKHTCGLWVCMSACSRGGNSERCSPARADPTHCCYSLLRWPTVAPDDSCALMMVQVPVSVPPLIGTFEPPLPSLCPGDRLWRAVLSIKSMERDPNLESLAQLEEERVRVLCCAVLERTRWDLP